MDREYPHNKEAEASLLGNLIIYSQESMPVAQEKSLMPDDFYIKENKEVYTAIVSLYNENFNIDIPHILEKLKELNFYIENRSSELLLRLQRSSVVPETTESYIDTVQNNAVRRRIIYTANKIANDNNNWTGKLEDILDKVEKDILEVTRNRRITSDFKYSSEVISEVYQKINDAKTRGGQLTGIKTGYQSLDSVTNGFQRGDLIILAARPSVGKTAYALNIALKAATYNKDGAVAIFSLEMGADQLMTRMLSADSAVAGDKLKKGINITSEDDIRILESANRLAKLNIVIDDNSLVTTSSILSKCRKLKADQGLNLIVIDYLQLITSPNYSRESRQQEVSEISRSLKSIARELDVPIIALSQLSRDVEKRTGNKPKLSDLRESGSIEQDADIVSFLYRPEYHNDEVTESSSQEVELILAKNRNGAVCTLHLMFDKTINAFFDLKRISE